MKTVSLKTQKKLLFIPLVSTAIMVIWFFINLRNLYPESYHKEMFKSLFFMCLSYIVIIPLSVLAEAIQQSHPFIYSMSNLIIYYIWSTISMGLLLYYQKKKGVK